MCEEVYKILFGFCRGKYGIAPIQITAALPFCFPPTLHRAAKREFFSGFYSKQRSDFGRRENIPANDLSAERVLRRKSGFPFFLRQNTRPGFFIF